MSNFSYIESEVQCKRILAKLHEDPRNASLLQELLNNYEEFNKHYSVATPNEKVTELPDKPLYTIVQETKGGFYVIAENAKLCESYEDAKAMYTSIEEKWERMVRKDPYAPWLSHCSKPIIVRLITSPM